MANTGHVILFGNAKGGSGKTTTAMHLIVGLLRLGLKIASIDLDFHQQSLSRYIENRKNNHGNSGSSLLLPEHFLFDSSVDDKRPFQEQVDAFISLLANLKESYDFIIIDTPGNITEMNKVVHSYSDTLITPINDSFLDFDLLGKMHPDSLDMSSPGIYSAMVFEQKLARASRDRKEMDWLVVRNRLPTLDTVNKGKIDIAIYKLSKKLRFRVSPGFGDRVVFKELFLSGLTLYDATVSNKIKMTTSILAARQELREFMKSLQLKRINDILSKQ